MVIGKTDDSKSSPLDLANTGRELNSAMPQFKAKY
jgi:hypothetical protein